MATTIKKLSFRIKNSLIIGMIDQLVGFEFQFIPAEFRILLGSVGISQLNEAITDRNVRGELLGDSPATLWEREAVLPGIGLNHFDIFRAKNIKQGIIDEIKNQFDFQFIEQKRQANNSGQNSATAHNLSESEQKLIWQDLQGQISDFLETIPKSRLSSFKFNNIEKDLKKIEKRSNGSNFNNGFWTQTWKKLNNIKRKDFKNKMTNRHIAFTNKKRMAINKMEMDKTIKQKKVKALELEGLCYDPNSQDVRLCAGMPVIARKNSKELNIFNNETFIIKSIKLKDNIIVVFDEGREQEVPIPEFTKMFNVAYCITVHKSQGATFDEAYTIHEFEQFDTRLKYVALSRATDINLINII